jgi:hypothetical protein
MTTENEIRDQYKTKFNAERYGTNDAKSIVQGLVTLIASGLSILIFVHILGWI